MANELEFHSPEAFVPEMLANTSWLGFDADPKDSCEAFCAYKIEEHIKSRCLAMVQGDTYKNFHYNFKHSIKFKRMLIPFWFFSYSYNNQTYKTIVNAVNGEIEGERPKTSERITKAYTMGCLPILCAIMYLLLTLIVSEGPLTKFINGDILHLSLLPVYMLLFFAIFFPIYYRSKIKKKKSNFSSITPAQRSEAIQKIKLFENNFLVLAVMLSVLIFISSLAIFFIARLPIFQFDKIYENAETTNTENIAQSENPQALISSNDENVIEEPVDESLASYNVIFKPKLIYPEEADGRGGVVKVEIIVGKDGRVSKASVIETTDEVFNEEALNCAKQFVFSPPHLKENPEKLTTMRLILSFRFNEAPDYQEKISKKESITSYQEKPTEQEVEENKAASSILKLIIGGGKFKEGTMDIYIDGNIFSRIPIDKYVNLTKDFEISSGQHVVYIAIYNKKGNLVLKGQEIQNFHKGEETKLVIEPHYLWKRVEFHWLK